MVSTPITRKPIDPAVCKYLAGKGFLHNTDAQAAALAYLEGRKNGTIRSIHTPWRRFNEAILDGIDWGMMVTLAGRPASGKTLAAAMISRRAFDLNPDQDFAVLDLQFEMHAKWIVMREISAAARKSVRELANADPARPARMEDIKAAVDFCRKNEHHDIFFYENPLTVVDMVVTVEDFLKQVKKPTIITIDHSLLFSRSKDEKSQVETLTNLTRALSLLRKNPRYQVIVLLLSQLNRDIESTDRMQNGTVGNYVKDSDLFGADAVLQNSDVVFSMHRPGKYGLTRFGAENYIIDPSIIVGQFLKVRTGSQEMQFYKADFANSNLYDISPPPTAPRTGPGADPTAGKGRFPSI